MLNLGRKLGERIELRLADGRVITIGVKSLADNQVTLGVDAPQDVRIWRVAAESQVAADTTNAQKVCSNPEKPLESQQQSASQ